MHPIKKGTLSKTSPIGRVHHSHCRRTGGNFISVQVLQDEEYTKRVIRYAESQHQETPKKGTSIKLQVTGILYKYVRSF